MPENLHGNKDLQDLDLVMTESPIPSDHVEFTTTTGSQRAGAETEKVPNDQDDMIDLTNVDNTISPPRSNKPTQESYINFSGMINTDTQTIKGQYHKTVNDTPVKVPPITLDTPSLGELMKRVNNQSKLIEEQQSPK